jgi:catechol 2,3-dioxygenase-like lactoylglutathione lyase family enzyme
VIHHVALEVSPGTVPEEVAFWTAAGFAEVPVPEALGDGYTWLESGGTQIHLMHTAGPVVPERGHVAVVAPDFDDAVERLRAIGVAVRPGRELWGRKRAKATSPQGHTVELMAAPPPVADG